MNVVVRFHAVDVFPLGPRTPEFGCGADVVMQFPISLPDEQIADPGAGFALDGFSKRTADAASAPCSVEVFEQFRVGKLQFEFARPLRSQGPDFLQLVRFLILPVGAHRQILKFFVNLFDSLRVGVCIGMKHGGFLPDFRGEDVSLFLKLNEFVLELNDRVVPS